MEISIAENPKAKGLQHFQEKEEEEVTGFYTRNFLCRKRIMLTLFPCHTEFWSSLDAITISSVSFLLFFLWSFAKNTAVGRRGLMGLRILTGKEKGLKGFGFQLRSPSSSTRLKQKQCSADSGSKGTSKFEGDIQERSNLGDFLRKLNHSTAL